MKKWYVFLLLVFLCHIVVAQRAKKKVRDYRVWVSIVDSPKQLKGYIYSVNSKGITIAKSRQKYSEIFDVSKLITVVAKDIDIIKIRRRGVVGEGFLFGTLAGIGVGVLVGNTTYIKENDVYSLGKITAIYLGTALGAYGGATIASKKKVIVIGGDFKKFENQIKTLQNYLLPRKN